MVYKILKHIVIPNNYTGDTVFIGRHQSGVNVADFDGYIQILD